VEKLNKRLYILEGPDGTGKTTLAKSIADATGGHILHGTYNESWDVKKYHETMLEAATSLLPYQDVVMDRWALSELVYGTVFRGEPAYQVMDTMKSHEDKLREARWIYCRHDDVVKNHERNKEIRFEMFDNMEKVQAMYDGFVRVDKEREWLVYDFGRVALNDFVIEITKE
jgi:thymidylate kinase